MAAPLKNRHRNLASHYQLKGMNLQPPQTPNLPWMRLRDIDREIENLPLQLPEELREQLAAGHPPSSSEIREMNALLSKFVLKYAPETGDKAKVLVAKIADVFVKKYPEAFEQKLQNEFVSDGKTLLQERVYNAVLYRKGKGKRKTKWRSGDSDGF